MRTIDKGKNEKIVSDYKQFRDDLVEKVGCYCSYCEMRIDNQPDIEHVISKSINPSLEFSWDNLLLACKNCNTVKGDKVKNRDYYYFPDEDNTSLLFKYTENYEVVLREDLNDSEKILAESTLNLYQPNRLYQADGKRLDRRWEARKEAYDKALRSYKFYKFYKDIKIPIKMIIDMANATGFPSLWAEIFQNYPEIVKVIYENFSGTDMKCFDSQMKPLRGIKGKI